MLLKLMMNFCKKSLTRGGRFGIIDERSGSGAFESAGQLIEN